MTALLETPAAETPAAPFSLPSMDEIAALDPAQLAALLEQMRQVNAVVRQTAVSKGVPLPDIATRKLTSSKMLAAAGRVARIRFDVDRYTADLEAATEELNAARTAYMASNSLTELPADLVVELEQADSEAYTARQQKAAERSAPATDESGTVIKASRRGRPRKATVSENGETENTPAAE